MLTEQEKKIQSLLRYRSTHLDTALHSTLKDMFKKKEIDVSCYCNLILVAHNARKLYFHDRNNSIKLEKLEPFFKIKIQREQPGNWWLAIAKDESDDGFDLKNLQYEFFNERINLYESDYLKHVDCKIYKLQNHDNPNENDLIAANTIDFAIFEEYEGDDHYAGQLYGMKSTGLLESPILKTLQEKALLYTSTLQKLGFSVRLWIQPNLTSPKYM